MKEYVNKKKIRSCFCVGPENCGDKTGEIVKRYQDRKERIESDKPKRSDIENLG
jgi:hypothetical protein